MSNLPASASRPRRALLRPAGLPLAALAAAACLAGPASAHVSVTPSDTAAGSSTLATFATGHGCDGSPTTSISISVPEEIVSVTPQRNPGWDVEVQRVDLDEPRTDSHGTEVTDRVSSVTWTARDPLADGVRDTFTLAFTVPEQLAGQQLAFPTIQGCRRGENAWTQVADAGTDPHSLDSPAPVFTVSEPAEPGEHGESEETTESEDPQQSGGGAGGWIGAGAGLLGLGAGLTALVRTRRR